LKWPGKELIGAALICAGLVVSEYGNRAKVSVIAERSYDELET